MKGGLFLGSSQDKEQRADAATASGGGKEGTKKGATEVAPEGW